MNNNIDHLEDACRTIENLCRSLGRDCQIIFSDNGVSIAPPSWSGDCFDKTLYSCLKEAIKCSDE